MPCGSKIRDEDSPMGNVALVAKRRPIYAEDVGCTPWAL
jgi:hypothetical protein